MLDRPRWHPVSVNRRSLPQPTGDDSRNSCPSFHRAHKHRLCWRGKKPEMFYGRSRPPERGCVAIVPVTPTLRDRAEMFPPPHRREFRLRSAMVVLIESVMFTVSSARCTRLLIRSAQSDSNTSCCSAQDKLASRQRSRVIDVAKIAAVRHALVGISNLRTFAGISAKKLTALAWIGEENIPASDLAVVWSQRSRDYWQEKTQIRNK